MPHRRVSPTPSENDIDISKSLTKDDVNGEYGDSPTQLAPVGAFDAGEIHDLRLESDEDGDVAFIAAYQAASNREASKLAVKSVKKGGGFQAMGTQLQPCTVLIVLLNIAQV
jgi:ATP-dependent RNA helicase DDX54/DBP10